MTLAIKARWRVGGTATMVNIRYPAAGLVEGIARLGFDAAFIDCEKRSFSTETIEAMARAARAAGIATIVRPWAHEAGLISRFLDIGADGVMVAAVDDASTARQLVSTLRFARHADFDDKVAIGIVESPCAVDNLAQLLEVDGVDAWFVGPNDLAHHMGYPGGAGRAEVRSVVRRVIATIVDAGKVCGINVDHDTVEDARVQGVRCLLVNIDTLLARGAADLLRSVRPGTAAATPRGT
jgi:2-keto-3-deoxy-L-rhamnonate aldolase RhmA